MSFFEKRNNLDELINIPTKAEEKSMVQFRLWPKIKHRDRHNPESAPKFTADPRSTLFSKSAYPLDLQQKSTIRALFKAKSVDSKSYSPPSFYSTFLSIAKYEIFPELKLRTYGLKRSTELLGTILAKVKDTYPSGQTGLRKQPRWRRYSNNADSFLLTWLQYWILSALDLRSNLRLNKGC